jgi:5'-methylthioadenosine phosphorylase
MKVGIIGGSGLDDPNLLQDYKEEDLDTKYGKPSSTIACGKISNVNVCILARHGRDHSISPSKINYRANVAALKILGCTHIIATSAVGSLKEHISPGDLVFPNQFIDFTRFRENTFYDEIGEVHHEPMADPFSYDLWKLLTNTAKELDFKMHNFGTIVVIEGPRFSTRSESFMFRNYADIIGMTAFPECVLAREAGMEYATVAMTTDYDCWKKDEAPVTFDMVMRRMEENADKVKRLIVKALENINTIGKRDVDREFIKSKIRTIPDFPKPGILFRDVTTLFKDEQGMKKVTEMFYNHYKDKKVEVVAGIESRGFIIGGILADKLNCGFVPIRKKGKLPAETEEHEYELEYGKDVIEIHKDAIHRGQRVLLIDDLIATGGTAEASCHLIEKIGGEIVGCGFIVSLPDLKGKNKISKYPIFEIVDFEGE